MASKKIKVGIIGTGNIGSDLLVKVMRSKYLEPGIFAGQNPDSPNIKRAKKMGVTTSAESIKAIEKNPDSCDIVFDATSAHAHREHAPILKRLGKFVIDLTPSHVGKMCVPTLNMDECLKEKNVSMITCGGQANIPIVAAIRKVHPDMQYAEIVSSISSKSAGIGTRDNIDEYTQSTSDGICMLADIPKTKAIIVINPAEPPVIMHNTLYVKIEKPKMKAITREIKKTVAQIKKYVPGYKLVLDPVFENNRVTIMTEVVGRGDFLPTYAGNLDIINCAAVAVAEEYAKKILHA